MFYSIFIRFLHILPWVFPSLFLLYVVSTTPLATIFIFFLGALWLSVLLLDEPRHLKLLQGKISSLQKAYTSFTKRYL
jgi:hypothetical protein